MTDTQFKSLEADICLQCGESRQKVNRDQLDCAVLDGYWQPELVEEWSEHHFDDWSDTELDAFGFPTDSQEDIRRHQVFDLRFLANIAICDRDGHGSVIEGTCMRCFREVQKVQS